VSIPIEFDVVVEYEVVPPVLDLGSVLAGQEVTTSIGLERVGGGLWECCGVHAEGILELADWSCRDGRSIDVVVRAPETGEGRSLGEIVLDLDSDVRSRIRVPLRASIVQIRMSGEGGIRLGLIPIGAVVTKDVLLEMSPGIPREDLRVDVQPERGSLGAVTASLDVGLGLDVRVDLVANTANAESGLVAGALRFVVGAREVGRVRYFGVVARP
jgi:hypothetical protein